ncbi:MAG: hypothetical protein AAB924_00985 [Patescibacteria group bacterium]
MFNQNKKIVATQERLIAHSGFVTNTGAESVKVSNEQMTFDYWFWHGGFLVIISYVVIVMGTGVFIRHLFSLIKDAKR